MPEVPIVSLRHLTPLFWCRFAFSCRLMVAVFTLISVPPALGDQVDFEQQIAPIFESSCSHCHGEDEQESGLRLDRRANLLRGGDSGLASIVPGRPDQSYLIEVINHVDQDTAMPPDDDKLSDEEIDLIARWIEQGAVWPGQMDQQRGSQIGPLGVSASCPSQNSSWRLTDQRPPN